MVSGQNATDKTLVYEMPLIYVFGVRGFGLGQAFFVLGFWAMAYCHWRFVPSSLKVVVFWIDLTNYADCVSLAVELRSQKLIDFGGCLWS